MSNSPNDTRPHAILHALGWLLPGVILLLSFLFWQRLQMREHIQALHIIDSVAVRARDLIDESIANDVRDLAGMGARWEVGGKPSRLCWEADAMRYVNESPGYQALEWIDPSLHIRWLVPLKGNEAAVNLNLLSGNRKSSAILTARDRGVITASLPIHLVQGGIGFLVYVPIFRQSHFEGIIAGVFRLDKVLGVLPRDVTSNYSIVLSEGGEEVYRKDLRVFKPDARWSRSITLNLRGVTWLLQVTPSASTVAGFRSPLPSFVLLIGFLTALLVGGLIFYARRAQESRLRAVASEAALRDAHEGTRKVVESIRASEENLNRAQALAHIGSWERDLKSGSGTWSEEMFRIHGIESAASAPSIEEYLQFVHRDDRQKVRDHVATGLEDLEFRLLRSDGSLRYVHVRSELIVDEHGTAVGLRGALLDITERRHAEDTIIALNAAMEQATEGIAYLNPEARYMYVNEAYARMSGYMQTEMLGKHFLCTLPEHRHAAALMIYEKMKAEGKAVYEVQGYRHSGELFYKEVALIRHLDPDGRFLGHYVFARDITNRKTAEEALHESEERFRSAIQSMHEGLTFQNRDGEIVVLNRRATEILGLTDEQLRGLASLDERWHAIHEDGSPWPRNTHPVMKTLDEGVEQSSVVMGIHKPDGQLTWVSINTVPLFHYDDNRPYAAVVTYSDISERKWFEEQIARQIAYVNEANVRLHDRQAELEMANARLEELATTDGLTGLTNHRSFQEALSEEYARAVRYSSPLSLLLLDVDHFKSFNDEYGHPAGDEVLKQVAMALKDARRASDLPARYGGEEFVVILPGTDQKGALESAERIRSAIESQPWKQRSVTVSVGAATLRLDTANCASFVSEADHALYESKAAGRNCVSHYLIGQAHNITQVPNAT